MAAFAAEAAATAPRKKPASGKIPRTPPTTRRATTMPPIHAGISSRVSTTRPEALRHDRSGATAISVKSPIPRGTASELK